MFSFILSHIPYFNLCSAFFLFYFFYLQGLKSGLVATAGSLVSECYLYELLFWLSSLCIFPFVTELYSVVYRRKENEENRKQRKIEKKEKITRKRKIEEEEERKNKRNNKKKERKKYENSSIHIYIFLNTSTQHFEYSAIAKLGNQPSRSLAWVMSGHRGVYPARYIPTWIHSLTSLHLLFTRSSCPRLSFARSYFSRCFSLSPSASSSNSVLL